MVFGRLGQELLGGLGSGFSIGEGCKIINTLMRRLTGSFYGRFRQRYFFGVHAASEALVGRGVTAA